VITIPIRGAILVNLENFMPENYSIVKDSNVDLTVGN
jgi:hypothetical protein